MGYLIILGSIWVCNTEAVENYQLLLVLHSVNSFSHAILQLRNAADKKNPYCLHSSWFVPYPNFANTMGSLGEAKKQGKNVNMLGEVFQSDLFIKTPVLLGAEGLQSSFLFFLSFRSFLFVWVFFNF